MVSAIATQALTFVVNLGSSYLLGRLQAQDGPRLKNKEAAGGDYGIPMARGLGEAVRVTGAFIAQDDIKETKHKVEDHSEIVGVVTGAAQGFLVGGPIGAVIGGAIGGLLGFAAPDQVYYTYSDTFAVLLLDRAGQDPIEGVLKIWANGKLIFSHNPANVVSETFDADGKLISRKYKKNKYFKSLTITGGHTDQPVNPVLAANVDEDSGYIFCAIAIFEDLQLAAFGNSVPPTEHLVQVKTGETVADAAEFFADFAGIDPERDISTTALADDTLLGYPITSETTCWDAIKPLLPTFAVDAAEVSGQVRFYRRSQSMRSVIPLNDMGSYMFGDSPPNKLAFSRDGDLSLPQQTSLTFIDADRDLQPNTATSSRTEGDARSNIAVTVPIVLRAWEGASAAALMHWDAWLGRTALSFTLTDAWISLATGYAYGIPFGDQHVPYRITRKLRGANGIIEVEALSDESVTYTASVPGSSGTMPPEESTEFPNTRLIIMDMPITSDDHDDYGFYIAQGGEAGWTRGRIEVSSDGTNFVTIIDQPFNAVMGDVTGTLPAGSTTGLDDTLDTTTVLTVVLLSDLDELEDATDAELDLWKNFAFVGKDGLGEYLQFKTATKVGFATWELTNLRRGRRGTDHAIGTHTSGEEFALLGAGGVFRIVYSDTSQWGEEYTFRGVTLHQDAEDAEEQTFTNTGEGKRPFSPINIEGTWDGSNNLTATFEHRFRMFDGTFGIDDNEEWEIQITNATPVRTIITTTQDFEYSAAEQTADGLVPERVIEGRIRATSDVNDGRWREFVLIGPAATILELEDDTTPFHLEDGTTLLELES